MKLLLVRHGDALNSTGGYYGSTETALTAAGVAQARSRRADFERFAPDAVWVSPARRARETLAEMGGAGEAVEELREIDFGRWEGCTFAEIAAAEPAKVAEWAELAPTFRFPGGESVAEFEARIRRLGDRVRALEGRVARLAVVTHGGIIRYLLADLLRLPATAAWIFELPPAALVRVTVEGGYARVTAIEPPAA